MIPSWLNVLALASLLAGFACATWIAFDETRHPQHVWIMNLVWPITALYGGQLARGLDQQAAMRLGRRHH